MKQAAVSILIFLFLGNSVLFSQDGEEIDFLEKVAEPKKTASKKSSGSGSSSNGAKVSKKKEKKKSKKKKSKKSSTNPSNPEGNQKKNVEPDNNGGNESSSGNSSSSNGSNSSNSNSGTQTLSSKNGEDTQLASASRVDAGDLPKPYWVNEEVKVRPDNLPGYTASAEAAQTTPQGPSFQSRLSDILKLGEDKKKEEEKKKVQEGQKSGSFTGFLSEYKKPIIIVVFILLFALYRLKAGKSRGSSGRRSPVTINKMRRD
ncbi:hypothetical protein EHQ12_03110 [Leptospira gomenensis]|uniref:Sec region non-globular protein n=1 Tax=Leptospira gomenensis TaxID=2484974 RepID=A0A5F1Y991_9LEPT|nr:SRP-less Sec system protein [Leptospira gomenensis]TGK31049.1 hypothetical protein EHQ17_15145 [Leptospira gomenensis]TGK43254.1 hypothetical protein EHQ12_03110 [Leptospira gomenensis]TGK45231.1 hypothetical protein EHQ07_09855 [Leptospira gomenensis]TGK66146.1 hypothetical protein EHQ13_03590 [Leptospira gomenensis]